MSTESVKPSNHLIFCCPIFFCPQSFPASGSFPTSWLFASGGQSIGALASVFLMNIQGWLPLGLTGLVFLLSKGLSRVFSGTTVLSHRFFSIQFLFIIQLSHPYMTTGKTIALTIWAFVGKVMSLLFNILSRFVIAFLPRDNCLLISWLQSPTTVILEPKKIKSVTVSKCRKHCFQPAAPSQGKMQGLEG